MKRLLYLSLMLFSVSVINAKDQRVIDSLWAILPAEADTNRLNGLLDLYIAHVYDDQQSAKEILDDYTALAYEIDNLRFIGTAHNMRGVYYNFISDYDGMAEELGKAIEIFIAIPDSSQLAMALGNLASTRYSQGRFTEALALHERELKVNELAGRSASEYVGTLWSLGHIQYELENYQSAYEWYDRAEEIHKEADEKIYVREMNYCKARCSYRMDSTVNIIPTVDAYIQSCREHQEYNKLAGSLCLRASLSSDRGELGEAEQFVNEALEVAQGQDEAYLLNVVYTSMTDILMQQEKYAEALPIALKALAFSEEQGTDTDKFDQYEMISMIYHELGDDSSALDYYQKLHTLKSKILSQENAASMNALEVAFETKEKENEILLLKQKDTISTYQKWGLGAGILALLFILGSLIFGQREKSKRRIAEREKLAAELESKKKELLAYTMQLAHKNEVLDGLRTELKGLGADHMSTELRSIVNTIDFNIRDNSNWEHFKTRFESVHVDFTKKLLNDYPNLSSGELRLASLLRMELNSKEMASLLNISQDGIKKARYRLRKKLSLESTDSLENKILRI